MSGTKQDHGKYDWWANKDRIAKYLLDTADGSSPPNVTCVVLSKLMSVSDVHNPFCIEDTETALHLLYPSFMDQYEQVLRVLEFGAKKYWKDGWVEVPNGFQRYWSAAVRHLIDEEFVPYGPEHIDEESGLPTRAHAACDIAFLQRFIVMGKY